MEGLGFKNEEAVDKSGTPVHPESPDAVQWCLVGAKRKILGVDDIDYSDTFNNIHWNFYAKLGMLIGEKDDPIYWNDCSATWEDVALTLKKIANGDV